VSAHDAALGRIQEVAAAAVRPEALGPDPDPLASASWQAGIALLRIAALRGEPGLADPDADRAELLEDLAVRGGYIREYAHRAAAAEQTRAQLAARTADSRAAAADEQVQILRARLDVGLPDGTTVTVHIGTSQDGEGCTSWGSTSPLLTGGVDGYAHLEIAAALDAIAAVLTTALERQEPPEEGTDRA